MSPPSTRIVGEPTNCSSSASPSVRTSRTQSVLESNPAPFISSRKIASASSQEGHPLHQSSSTAGDRGMGQPYKPPASSEAGGAAQDPACQHPVGGNLGTGQEHCML